MGADGTGAFADRGEELRSMLAAIVESSQDAIIGGTVDGVITTWNTGAARMYGYAANEIIGRDISQLVPADRADEIPSVLGLLRQGRQIEHFDTYRVRKDGTVIPVSVSVSPILDATGAVIGAASVARDMTERNRAEADRRAAELRLRHVERMETVGQLAGGIAQDFNNLFGAISAFAGFIADAAAFDSDLRSDAEEIQAAAARGAALVKQLLAFSSGAPGTPAPVDLNDVVMGSRSLLTAGTGGLRLELELGSGLPPVVADRDQVEQVLLNLVVNARDAMPDGGTVTITTSNAELTGEDGARDPEVRPGSYVELDVSDTGTGMSREILARIFEPFFTTKPAGRGTGLGLSAVYGIVHHAGGGILVDSAEGRGSTFRLYFPPVQAGRPAAPGQEGATVLVVDDEPSVLAVTGRILRQHGYTVHSAGSGDAALAVAAEHDFQLLLTDAVMPDITGPALASRIREMKPGIPVLHMSGLPENRLPGHEPDLDFLPKPFTAEQLLEKVRIALSGTATAHDHETGWPLTPPSG